MLARSLVKLNGSFVHPGRVVRSALTIAVMPKLASAPRMSPQGKTRKSSAISFVCWSLPDENEESHRKLKSWTTNTP